MNKTYAELKRITNATEVEVISALAKVDKHDVIAPTHVVLKNKKISGYFSIGAVPFWLAHLQVGVVEPHDTYNLIHTVENIMQLNGAQFVVTPVGLDSPIHARMESKGYRKLATVDLFIKEF